MGTYPEDQYDLDEYTEAAVDWYIKRYGIEPITPSHALEEYEEWCEIQNAEEDL